MCRDSAPPGGSIFTTSAPMWAKWPPVSSPAGSPDSSITRRSSYGAATSDHSLFGQAGDLVLFESDDFLEHVVVVLAQPRCRAPVVRGQGGHAERHTLEQ